MASNPVLAATTFVGISHAFDWDYLLQCLWIEILGPTNDSRRILPNNTQQETTSTTSTTRSTTRLTTINILLFNIYGIPIFRMVYITNSEGDVS